MNHKIKYHIKKSKRTVSVTLTVPNDAESMTWLHDLVAIRVAEAGQFIGEVYHLPESKRRVFRGEFEARYKTYAEALQ